MATIIGIDPGSRVTGFGVLEVCGHQLIHITHGVICMDLEASFSERMKQLGESLQEIFLKHQPQHVSIEKIFLGRNADSAFKLGHARGVAMYEAARANAQVVEYATRLVKKGIVGTGAAEKEAVRAALQSLLKIKGIARLDASDALALAVYHAFQLQNKSVWVKAVEI